MAYTLVESAYEDYSPNAEFAFGRQSRRNKRLKGQLMGRTGLGRAARVGGLLAGAGALRYGGAAIKGARGAMAPLPKASLTPSAITNRVSTGVQGASKQVVGVVKNDVARVGGAAKGVKSSIRKDLGGLRSRSKRFVKRTRVRAAAGLRSLSRRVRPRPIK